MTDVLVEEIEHAPIAHVTLFYRGPVAPHWEMRRHFGEDKVLDSFWARAHARLLLLPKHDPQFRRNRERVNRDAEREGIVCSWDLGEHDDETVIVEAVAPVEAEVVEVDIVDPEAEVVEVDVIEEDDGDVEIDVITEDKTTDVAEQDDPQTAEADSSDDTLEQQ